MPMTQRLLAWGAAADGQLGTGGTDSRAAPTDVAFFADAGLAVRAVAVGTAHACALVDRGGERGLVFTWGCNDAGQLGHGGRRLRPSPVAALESKPIVAVACGGSHTLAADASGGVFAWGSNASGELGSKPDADAAFRQRPRLVHFPSAADPGSSSAVSTTTTASAASASTSPIRIVHIAAGLRHSLAVDSHDAVWSFGDSANGRLGRIPTPTSPAWIPAQIRSLYGLPIRKIVCGGNHSAVLTAHGSIFVWGANAFGQLGLGHRSDAPLPVQIPTLKDAQAVDIACGEAHTAVLLASGQLFVFGAGAYGELGLGITVHINRPLPVLDLLGSHPAGVVCGRRHTIVLMDSPDSTPSDANDTANLRVFGLNSSGQLGLGTSRTAVLPMQLHLPAPLCAIYAGLGDTCFALINGSSNNNSNLQDSQIDASIFEPAHVMPIQNEPQLCSTALQITNDHQHQAAQNVFASIGNVNAAFIVQDFSKADLARHPCIDLDAVHALFDTNTQSSGTSVVESDQTQAASENTTPEAASVTIDPADASVVKQLSSLSRRVSLIQSSHPETLRIVHILLSVPLLHRNPILIEHHAFAHDLVLSLNNLNDQQWLQLGNWWRSGVKRLKSSKSPDDSIDRAMAAMRTHFAQTVLFANRVLSHIIESQDQSLSNHFKACAAILDRLWAINNLGYTLNSPGVGCVKSAQRVPPRQRTADTADSEEYVPSNVAVAPAPTHETLVPPRLFINNLLVMTPELLSDYMVVHLSPFAHVHQNRMHPTRYPFLFNLRSKAALLEADYRRQMFECQSDAFISQWQTGLASGGPLAFVLSNMINNGMFGGGMSSNTGTADNSDDGDSGFVTTQESASSRPATTTSDTPGQDPQSSPPRQRSDRSSHRPTMSFSAIVSTSEQPYTLITLRRSHLFEDAVSELASKRMSDIKKPLRVKFDGELGVDEGGVSAEFFTLFWARVLEMDLFEVVDEEDSAENGVSSTDKTNQGDNVDMMQPDVGLSDSRRDHGAGLRPMMVWFHPATTASTETFHMVGRVFGMALYNARPIPVAFPPVFFRKLLSVRQTGGIATSIAGESVESALTDLREFRPALARSLESILHYEGDVESMLSLDFTVVHRRRDGSVVEHELVTGGRHRPVTATNREEYVRAYARWIVHRSCSETFTAFQRGFMQVCRSPIFDAFSTEDLITLLCGDLGSVDDSAEQDTSGDVAIDFGDTTTPVTRNRIHHSFADLEPLTQYREPYNRNHDVVRRFWSVVRTLSSRQQRLLLRFVTGTDRLPLIEGLRGIKFCIQRSGMTDDVTEPDSSTATTAHTDDTRPIDNRIDTNTDNDVSKHDASDVRETKRRRVSRVGGRLPSAHTCTHVLDLPPYDSEEELRERLLYALDHLDGFHLA